MENLPEIVVFDLGGVLVRICRSPQEALEAVGFRSSESIEFSEPNTYVRLNRRYQSGQIPLTEFLEETGKLLRSEVPSDALLAAHDRILIGEYLGALEVVSALQAQGVKTCVLSNTCARHWTKLSEFSAVKQASKDGCYLSFELGLVKPDVEIYRYVEAELGKTGASIGFIDDSVDNIQAASKLGWQAIHVEHERENSVALGAALAKMGFTL